MTVIAEKARQSREILSSSRYPTALLLDMLRLKRADYIAECRGRLFSLQAGRHEWYTLIENMVRQDYLRGDIALRDGDTVLDIGANFGAFAVLASGLVGKHGRVIAYEPNPTVFRRLVKNVQLNALSNVDLRDSAVGGSDGTIDLFVQERSSLTTTLANVDSKAVSTSTRVQVQVQSFNQILHDLQRVDLVKIDCEGAEYEIFDRIDPAEARKIRQIAMEVHRIAGRSDAEIPRKLRDLGFEVAYDFPMLKARHRSC